jgi:hypothetical protein
MSIRIPMEVQHPSHFVFQYRHYIQIASITGQDGGFVSRETLTSSGVLVFSQDLKHNNDRICRIDLLDISRERSVAAMYELTDL